MKTVPHGTCAKCGYDLGGLPWRGTCPECGNEYDGDTRHGFASHAAQKQAKLDRILARMRTIFLALVALSSMTCAGISSAIGSTPARSFAVGTIFFLLFLLAAVVSYLYEKPEE